MPRGREVQRAEVVQAQAQAAGEQEQQQARAAQGQQQAPVAPVGGEQVPSGAVEAQVVSP